MSMGPFYENVNNRDFRMYFNGAMIYIYGDAKRGGCVYMLNVDADADSRALAHDTTHTLDRLTHTTDFPEQMHILGSELFMRQDIRIHRMPIEYLPFANGVRRVSAEPSDRRAFKGTSMSMISALAVVEAAHPMTQWEWDSLQTAVNRTTRMSALFADGITQVLNIGFARCMSSLVTPEQARRTTQRMVLSMLLDKKGPASVVPDFPLAIVRVDKQVREDGGALDPTPADKDRYGLVLYRGFVVGTVHEDEGELVFTGRELASESDHARNLRREGVSDMTTRMFADKVVWSLWEAAPLEQLSVYERIIHENRSPFDDMIRSGGLLSRATDAFHDGEVEEEPEDWPEDDDEEEYEDDE